MRCLDRDARRVILLPLKVSQAGYRFSHTIDTFPERDGIDLVSLVHAKSEAIAASSHLRALFEVVTGIGDDSGTGLANRRALLDDNDAYCFGISECEIVDSCPF